MYREINAIIAIAARDLTKLFRDRARIAASFVFPVIFIGLLGTSLQTNLKDGLQYNFLAFVFTGVLAQTLFQSTASGIISLIEDRQTDFAQEMFIAPISRYSIILGKILGETLVSMVQVLGVLVFGVLIGVPLSFGQLLALFPFAIMICAFGGAFGLLIMSNISDQRSVNQLFPFIMFPQFFLAGVFNPIQILPWPLLIVSRLAPMTYAVDLFRNAYYFDHKDLSYTTIMPFWIDIVVCITLFLIFLILGTYLFVRKEKNR